ncbi:related to Staphylococcus multidrug resistance protein [Saccharomycodes ludwigii]|uniref:Related to Staphylococcus multidrug resistance protein n=1 Tax=Saccharomycodes ludwigii TaxID=36035 RepID=A0A376B778_9ASCO|nr:hypothetical protein SCDLUD_000048 [Saccharomycodes ludwigii]KAH3902471.1 hypothetical protein SCDLUD_000048 [Saccharomycodes ludwigii]SSD60481.1 related to Staphylococcus multidrug resistance protein [Saccharomycodes ludwigii]
MTWGIFTHSFAKSPLDIKLLWISVFLRLVSYGLTDQIITLFLNEIGISEDQMGLFMTLTLFGDVLLSYILTWYADHWGRRLVLIYGAVMMSISGMVFSYFENFYVLLLAAILGVIAPSSDEVGPFKSIEESVIAHLTPNTKRPEIYSLHAFFGTIGSAIGSMLSGLIMNFLLSKNIFKTNLQCYKFIFVLYSIIALCKTIIMCLLSPNIELYHKNEPSVESETSTLLNATNEDVVTPLTVTTKLSTKTISLLIKLLIIFMLDSFGYGFLTSSWMVYYYSKTFPIQMTFLALGALFSVGKIITAVSSFPSSILARMFGPVRATLLVQIPSGIFFILIPLCKPHLLLSILFLYLYLSTTAMDVTPRQLLLTNLIPAQDLTKVMGIVNIGKTFARCIGPTFTGLLANKGELWVCFIISGGLTILADFILYLLFNKVDKKILRQTNN